MKRLIFLFVILVCVMSAQAVEYFRYTNAEGVELRYRIINTKEVAVASDVNPSLWDSTVVNYPNILCDSIRIPDTVEYNGNSYMVFGIDNYSFACMKNVKKVILPKTIRSAPSLAFNYNSGIEEIIVDEENPYYTTVNGVMYTKDMKCLTAYPSAKPDPVFIVPEGPQSVAMFAFIFWIAYRYQAGAAKRHNSYFAADGGQSMFSDFASAQPFANDQFRVGRQYLFIRNGAVLRLDSITDIVRINHHYRFVPTGVSLTLKGISKNPYTKHSKRAIIEV